MSQSSHDVSFSGPRNDRRRTILRIIRSKPSATLQELVDAIVAQEGGASDSAKLRERVAISLYHVDVPKLADAGLVTFEPATRTVQAASPVGPAVR